MNYENRVKTTNIEFESREIYNEKPSNNLFLFVNGELIQGLSRQKYDEIRKDHKLPDTSQDSFYDYNEDLINN